jgi:hypothetical protein
LWTALIAPAYPLHSEPRLWAYLLGAFFLALTGWLVQRLSQLLFSHDRLIPLLSGVFCVLEWHLAWAAFSGMETILFVFLSLLVLERYLAGERPLLTGLAGGLLVLTRPEGAVLLLILISDTVLRLPRSSDRPTRRSVVLSICGLVIGSLLPVVPYLALNMSITGNPFPNTLYAKQAEYQEVVASLPFWAHWTRVVFVTIVGAQALLVPGIIHAGYKGVAARERRILIPLAWWAVLITLYALRLPVTYQHGRYMIPSIPLLILLGVGGTANLPSRHRILRHALFISIPILLLAFWILGAEQYAADVRIIDSELTAGGVWIRDNTPRSSVVGAHDIGAIGYFSERFLVDTAGLITPEVIPFIRDEDGILAFLEAKGVDYVAIFPSWYPRISRDARLRPVYRSTSQWIVEAGGDNIVVYEANWDATK